MQATTATCFAGGIARPPLPNLKQQCDVDIWAVLSTV
jgi:hypothetical protein